MVPNLDLIRSGWKGKSRCVFQGLWQTHFIEGTVNETDNLEMKLFHKIWEQKSHIKNIFFTLLWFHVSSHQCSKIQSHILFEDVYAVFLIKGHKRLLRNVTKCRQFRRSSQAKGLQSFGRQEPSLSPD